MKICFLYTELAAYTLSCFAELEKQGHELMVFRYPVNAEAPFHFKFSKEKTFLNRREFDLKGMIASIEQYKPELMFCSGWIDREYVEVCKHFRKAGVKTILCIDNKWTASIKQRLAGIYSRLFLKPHFDFAWVPGKSQSAFAQKLGFSPGHITDGFYCADTDLYSGYYQMNAELKNKNYPKRFLYTGRYYEFKGLPILWDAFVEFHKSFPEWELWCAGTGTLAPVNHPGIRHFGFVQPEEMKKLIAQCGVFVLPSLIEPWGVVVQEMAVAGMPLLLSDKVGAAEKFSGKENGLLFEAGNKSSLLEKMVKFARLNEKELSEMGKSSHEIGMSLTTQMWAKKIESFK